MPIEIPALVDDDDSDDDNDDGPMYARKIIIFY